MRRRAEKRRLRNLALVFYPGAPRLRVALVTQPGLSGGGNWRPKGIIIFVSLGSFSKQEKWKKWKIIAKTSIRMLFECSYLFHFFQRRKKVETSFHFLCVKKWKRYEHSDSILILVFATFS